MRGPLDGRKLVGLGRVDHHLPRGGVERGPGDHRAARGLGGDDIERVGGCGSESGGAADVGQAGAGGEPAPRQGCAGLHGHQPGGGILETEKVGDARGQVAQIGKGDRDLVGTRLDGIFGVQASGRRDGVGGLGRRGGVVAEEHRGDRLGRRQGDGGSRCVSRTGAGDSDGSHHAIGDSRGGGGPGAPAIGDGDCWRTGVEGARVAQGDGGQRAARNARSRRGCGCHIGIKANGGWNQAGVVGGTGVDIAAGRGGVGIGAPLGPLPGLGQALVGSEGVATATRHPRPRGSKHGTNVDIERHRGRDRDRGCSGVACPGFGHREACDLAAAVDAGRGGGRGVHRRGRDRDRGS